MLSRSVSGTLKKNFKMSFPFLFRKKAVLLRNIDKFLTVILCKKAKICTMTLIIL